MKLVPEYRLRWSRTGDRWRTRFYSRRGFALRRGDRYRREGYQVQLHRRYVVVQGDWELDTEPTPKAAPTCQHCGQVILQVDGQWVAADDPDTGWPYCSTEQSGGPTHAP